MMGTRIRLTQRQRKADDGSIPYPGTVNQPDRKFTPHDKYDNFVETVNHPLPDMRHDWKNDSRDEIGFGIPEAWGAQPTVASVKVAAHKAVRLAILLLGEKTPEEVIEAQARDFMLLGPKVMDSTLERYASTQSLYASDELADGADKNPPGMSEEKKDDEGKKAAVKKAQEEAEEKKEEEEGKKAAKKAAEEAEEKKKEEEGKKAAAKSKTAEEEAEEAEKEAEGKKAALKKAQEEADEAEKKAEGKKAALKKADVKKADDKEDFVKKMEEAKAKKEEEGKKASVKKAEEPAEEPKTKAEAEKVNPVGEAKAAKLAALKKAEEEAEEAEEKAEGKKAALKKAQEEAGVEEKKDEDEGKKAAVKKAQEEAEEKKEEEEGKKASAKSGEFDIELTSSMEDEADIDPKLAQQLGEALFGSTPEPDLTPVREASEKKGIAKLGGQPKVAGQGGAVANISDIWDSAPDVSEVFK